MPPAYVCLLPFDVDEPEFVRGFEIGRLWALLSSQDFSDDDPEEPVIEPTVIHATNAEMVIRVAEALFLTVRSRELDETWIEVSFYPQVPA